MEATPEDYTTEYRIINSIQNKGSICMQEPTHHSHTEWFSIPNSYLYLFLLSRMNTVLVQVNVSSSELRS
jgi:hypothetical protein